MIFSLMGDMKIEEERPYVGDVVWSLFFAYRAFNIRLIHLARSSLSNPTRVSWVSDAPTRSLIAATLSTRELAELDRLTISKVAFVRRTIEDKVLVAWQKLISGEEFGHEALSHANSLLKVVNASED